MTVPRTGLRSGEALSSRGPRLGGPGSLAAALDPPDLGDGFGPESLIFADDFELGSLALWDLVFPSGPYWTVIDYIRRDGGQLLAAADVGGEVRHFHLDHLGTPRLITDQLGEIVAYHAYHPFGEEATSPTTDAEVMKFTGHQRDLMTTTSQPQDDVDYLHARFSSPTTARFLSTDPAGGGPGTPQNWNRYSYVQGNPLKFLDPDGENPALIIPTIGFAGLGYAGYLYATEGPKSADQFLRIDLPELLSVAALTEAAGVLSEAALGKIESLVEGVSAQRASSTVEGPVEAYNRLKHYRRTPTAADRRALGASAGEVVNHEPALVKRYWEGDPGAGEKPGHLMTAAERRASANDRRRMNLQPRLESCKQGSECQRYSREMNQRNHAQQ